METVIVIVCMGRDMSLALWGVLLHNAAVLDMDAQDVPGTRGVS